MFELFLVKCTSFNKSLMSVIRFPIFRYKLVSADFTKQLRKMPTLILAVTCLNLGKKVRYSSFFGLRDSIQIEEESERLYFEESFSAVCH